MSDHTKIEWTDATWNPITGCSVVSPGCTNCYAMKLAGTRLRNHPSRAGLTQDTKAGPVWNGKVRMNEQWIEQPLDWARRRMVFVCAHGDLFHEEVERWWIVRVFAVMIAAHLIRGHIFQVLTKRAGRAHELLNDSAFWEEVNDVADGIVMDRVDPLNRRSDDARATMRDGYGISDPPPGIWLGVSAEDQRRYDERVEHLRNTPAAVRWVSAEPLLGEIVADLRGIDWLVAGGESGAGARPMHPDWVRSLRDQCAAAGTAFFFKQWGEWQVASIANGHHDGNMARNSARWVFPDGVTQKPSCIREGWAGGEPYAMASVGKKISGRQLDGREHNEYPEAK